MEIQLVFYDVGVNVSKYYLVLVLIGIKLIKIPQKSYNLS
jgi:hypothetical protein